MCTGTCKTCAHWSYSFKVKNGIADCGFIDTSAATIDSAKSMEIEISVADDSNLSYHFMTGSDFGCIHHKTTKPQ